MSNKPRKHSEEQKSRESSARRMRGRWGAARSASPTIPINPERHLIVTEGEKTEPYYFEAIRGRINARYHGRWVTVQIVGAGANTVSLMNRARQIASDDATGFTHVWVVYDKDDFSSEDFNAVAEMCEHEHAGGAQFHAVWSNECFELWYILHFEYMSSDLSRTSYASKLTASLEAIGEGQYRKNRSDMFDILESRLDSAMENASKLEQFNRGKTPADSAPGTTVHKLVDHLRPFFN